jgi:hypothetical protein
MDAWILHIQILDSDDGKNNIEHKQSAWASEKQAFKAAGAFINDDMRSWHMDVVLLNSAKALVNQDKILLAISLINSYSQFDTDRPDTKGKSKQYNFAIIKSTFQGSAFE